MSDEADRILNAVSDMGSVLVRSGSLDQMLRSSAELIVRYLDAAFARIWLLDEKDEVLILRASAGLYTHLDGGHARVPVGKLKIGLIAEERKPHLSNDLLNDERISDPDWVMKEGMKAFAGHPLMVSDKLIGVIAMFSRSLLPQDSLKLLKALSDLIASGIEQRRSLADLIQSEGRMRAIFETAPDGMLVVTTQGIIESANVYAHRMFAYQAGELVGKPITDVVESLFVSGGGSERQRLNTGERRLFGVGFECSGFKKSGEKFPVEVSSSLLNLGTSSYVFIAGVRDVTERHRSQQVQAQLAAIVESTGDAIIGKSTDGRINSWNTAAQKLYGWTAAKIIGSPMDVFIPSDKRAEFGRLFESVVRGHKVEQFETEHITSAGNRIDVSLTISPIKDASGRVVGVSTVSRDVSMKKEAERRVSEFYSMVSHELRTPLTSIRASLGLLEGGIAGALSKDAEQLVEIARMEADRLVRLINEILDLRKIEAGRLELRMQELNCSTLVSSVIQGMQVVADEAKISLTYVESEPIKLRCDRDRITQVITNLVSNAIKFSEAGTTVCICVRQSSRAGFVRFSIKDDGIGIAPEQQHKLFGKFQQVDSSDARRQGGTGLGLAITKAIVEQHGGRVAVESDLGKGSTFWFELPQYGLKSTSFADCPAAGTVAHTVLLVEDDQRLAMVLEKLLQAQGYLVAHAGTIAAATALLEEMRPDVILLDVLLPDGNGLDFMQSVWKRSETMDIPFVVLSAVGPNTYRSPLLVDWVSKPFDDRRLRRALRSAVRTRPGEPVTVLVVEDDFSVRSQLVGQIESLGVKCVSATDGGQALELALKDPPDLIVLDLGIPPPDGFEVVNKLRESRGMIPLLVYTGRDLSQDEKERLSLGITRYLTKSTASESEVIATIAELLDGLLEPEGG